MSELTFEQHDCEPRLRHWREIIDTVAKQLTDLLWQREQIRRIGKMIDENPRLLASNKPFLWDARRWYVFFAVMAVRRQSDKINDVYSLHRVLVEMRKHPECINRDMVVALFHDDGGSRYDGEFETMLIDDMWRDYATADGHFDVGALASDLTHLEDISKQIARLASKSIAHTTKQQVSDEPQLTFNDLDECIDAFDRIAVKYIRLLRGAGMSGSTLMPTEQCDWYEEFSFAWKPRARLEAWPDPWPNTPEEVRRWQITDVYDRFFKNRVNVIEGLFEHDKYSIDGTALAVLALGALAERRFADEQGLRVGKDQRRFRMLLSEHCPSFENRMCIPEMRRVTRKYPRLAPFEQAILRRWPIEGLMRMRRAEEDPLVEEFDAWANEQSPPIPDEFRQYDYAGCIFRLYRNSVVHELQPSKGREGLYSGPDESERVIFYSNYAGGRPGESVAQADPLEYMRFGIHPPYLLSLLREAVSSLRQWALMNDRDLFTDEDHNGESA